MGQPGLVIKAVFEPENSQCSFHLDTGQLSSWSKAVRPIFVTFVVSIDHNITRNVMMPFIIPVQFVI